MLQNWNFYDEELNSTTQQVNRQKSTRHLEILQFDPSVPRAVFTALHSSSVIARILISQEVHETNDGNLKALLLPYPADQMRMWEISPRVNSPKNDDRSLSGTTFCTSNTDDNCRSLLKTQTMAVYCT